EHGDRDTGAERRLDRRRVLANELILKRQRVVRDNDALAQLRRRDCRHEIRDRLAHARARLGHECATIRERPLDGRGELALLATILVACEFLREWTVSCEDLLD